MLVAGNGPCSPRVVAVVPALCTVQIRDRRWRRGGGRRRHRRARARRSEALPADTSRHFQRTTNAASNRVRVFTLERVGSAPRTARAVGSMSGLTDAGITAEQLAQMQGSGPGGGMTAQDAQNMKQKQQEQEGQRQEMLTRLMAPEAKERLNRISLVKPDKVRTHPSSAHPPPPAHVCHGRRHASWRTWS